MDVDTTQIKVMAERLRRSTRQGEVLALCDAVIAWRPMGASFEIRQTEPITTVSAAQCPVCEARRKAKALAMKRWRKSNESNA